MLGNLLIGLREGLEASLVVSILVAYLVKTQRPHLLGRLWSGVAAAVGLSLVLAAVLTWGPASLDEETQEAIGGVLSLIAVALVTWMILWMATAGRTLATDLRARVDAAVDNPWALPLVAFVAVGREGLETALFLWASTNASDQTEGPVTPALGAIIGLAIAVALAYLLYRGAVRINLGSFFTATGAFLVIVAAGVLAYGVHELQEAHILAGEDDLAFDLTHIIDPRGLPAIVVRGVFNLRPAMSVAEVGAWIGYLVIVGALFTWQLIGNSRRHVGTGTKDANVTAASH